MSVRRVLLVLTVVVWSVIGVIPVGVYGQDAGDVDPGGVDQDSGDQDPGTLDQEEADQGSEGVDQEEADQATEDVDEDPVDEEPAAPLCDADSVSMFTDVEADDYAADYILCMRALGLSVGTGEGAYGPDREMTRRHAAAFLVGLWRNVLGNVCPESGFDGGWTSMDCLTGLGVLADSDGFAEEPHTRITPSELSLLMYRIYGLVSDGCIEVAGEGDELERGLACLHSLRVIPSVAEGSSEGPVTRAQAAVYLIGLWHNLAGLGLPPHPPEVRDCTPDLAAGSALLAADPVKGAVELSALVFPCADRVGLAPVGDLMAAGSLVAAGLDGPLLLVGDDGLTAAAIAELDSLAPDGLMVAGLDPDELAALEDREAEWVDVDPDAALDIPPPAPSEVVWVVSSDGPVAPVAMVAAGLDVALVVAEGDLRALGPEVREVIAEAEQVELVSDLGGDAGWQLETIRAGEEIPGGGLLMFDGEVDRRLIALYGHPATGLLGVLGEQSARAGVDRLDRIATGYDADGATILPTFEIIATVASAGAGPDGDYSALTRKDLIRPWIETAAEHGVYVVLDLQPGRTDFLTQAKLYEEFLRLPHVGLALDPEWRLKPDEVHLVQIGSVDAAEVNLVVDWLAALVREEALPQKLLIVHQFRHDMITNRDLIETPSELAVVIQMDGQGSLNSKYTTWNVLTKDTEELGFRWGWKNFYDEDSPTATPEQVLRRKPTPVFVSFQ